MPPETTRHIEETRETRDRDQMTVPIMPPRTQPRTCEVCAETYMPTYSKQRTCGRRCGWTLRGRAVHLSKRDLNAPIAREIQWLKRQAKRNANRAMLARYHADPANWTTRRKRRRLFERDAWTCRTCGKRVTDEASAGHPSRAVAGHIIARATGGQWEDENMATLCHPCNVRDGVNRIPIQTAMSF